MIVTDDVKKRPTVSIVTVCFNAAESIETTLRSVQSQTYGPVEYIVVDGASTDATPDIVRRYARIVTKLVCEKDDGIFDAMNKGIALATGDVVYFLNADDSFVDDGVLADIVAAFEAHPACELIFGNVILEGMTNGVLNYPARPFKTHSISEFLHNSFCHQAVFVRRSMFGRLGLFETRYRYSADYEWIIRAFKAKRGRDFHFVDRNIAYYSVLGRSQQNVGVTNREVVRMQFRHFLSLEYLWYYLRYHWIRGLRNRLRPTYSRPHMGDRRA